MPDVCGILSGMKNSPETLAKRNALKKHWRDTIDPDTVPKTVIRKCKVCGETKECRWLCSFTQTGEPEYRAKCNDCQNEYLRTRAKASRVKMTSQAIDRRGKAKKRCVDYLGGKCIRCGFDSCLKALTFHHRAVEDKEYTISAIQDYSWAVLGKELDKCDLLCFNCHMEEHCALDYEIRKSSGHPRKVGCNNIEI